MIATVWDDGTRLDWGDTLSKPVQTITVWLRQHEPELSEILLNSGSAQDELDRQRAASRAGQNLRPRRAPRMLKCSARRGWNLLVPMLPRQMARSSC